MGHTLPPHWSGSTAPPPHCWVLSFVATWSGENPFPLETCLALSHRMSAELRARFSADAASWDANPGHVRSSQDALKAIREHIPQLDTKSKKKGKPTSSSLILMPRLTASRRRRCPGDWVWYRPPLIHDRTICPLSCWRRHSGGYD